MKPDWLFGLQRGLRFCSCRSTTFDSSSLHIRQGQGKVFSRKFTAASILRADVVERQAMPAASFGEGYRGKKEIDQEGEGKQEDGQDKPPKKVYARLVPQSPSYFTASPMFTDDLLLIQDLYQRYKKLPTVPPPPGIRIGWTSYSDYRNIIGEPVKSSKYYRAIGLLKRLNQIHPDFMPPEVRDVVNDFKRGVTSYELEDKAASLDKWGRALGAGKRKRSTARAWLVEGTGEVLVNGKTLADAFARIHDRESAIWPLKATDRLEKYNVWARVSGGGTTGQAEALTLAVARALMGHEPALKPALRRAGCVTRDPRRVERKKPGHVKARKMPAWVKR